MKIKYKGKVYISGREYELVKDFKLFHNKVKKFYIDKYSKNQEIVVDVGSGRGSDVQYHYVNNVGFLIGIEPSPESIKRAVAWYFKTKKKYPDRRLRISYLNGVGQKKWDNGNAALNKKDKYRFINYFGKNNIKANTINMFWTIHYMMDAQKDINTLFYNINNHILNTSYLVISCMDGNKIHKYLQNNNGKYEIIKNGEVIFRLTSKYDHQKNIKDLPLVGNKIGVYILGAYGLSKEICENIVFIDKLTKFVENHKFKLIEHTDYLNIEIPERNILTNEDIKVPELYTTIVFEKIL